MRKIEGGCRCGAVRYALDIERIPPAYACHCLDCQTWSGSAFSLQVLVPEAALSASGPLALYEMSTPSGRVSRQRMCSVCHARVFNTNSARPGVVVIRAGTLDRSDELEVAAHIWVKRKQAWLQLPQGVPAWPESAPLAELAQALSRED